MNFSRLFSYAVAIMFIIGSAAATDKLSGKEHHKKTVKRSTIDLDLH